MGFFQGILTFAKRHPLLVLFAVAALVMIAPAVHDIVYPPTPAQAIAAEQARAQEEAQREERKRETKYLCRLASICSRFTDVRQECATAGSFDNCVKVKIGDDDASEIAYCTNDGKIAFPPSVPMPSRLQCFLGVSN